MTGAVRFLLDGEIVTVSDFDPTMTVLEWLRTWAGRTGTKEGCAEGDCGACTVVVGELAPGFVQTPDDLSSGKRDRALEPVRGKPARLERIQYRALNACILFLPMLDGKVLVTVESLKRGGQLHPVQQAMVDLHGSQCGFCTPGIVMSLYARSIGAAGTDAEAKDVLAGNLCRCTGYGPILAAAEAGPAEVPDDRATVTALMAIQRDDVLSLTHDGRRWFAPKTADQLADLLLQYPDARIVAGATDVGLWVTKQQRVLPDIIHIGDIAELATMRDDGDTLTIGAAVRYAEAQKALAELHPDLGELVRRVGGVQVRNSGTIGGNIANGSPIGDMPPALIALGARLILRRGEVRRVIDLEGYFLTYGQQDLNPSEFIEAIIVPKPQPFQRLRIVKISKRFDSDISAVCAAFCLHMENNVILQARITFGGMAGTPKRATHAEKALTGADWSLEALEAAARALNCDFTPLSDVRGSADYRLIPLAISCAGYGSSRTACLGRGRSMPDAETPIAGLVHRALPHDSAERHVTGEAIYTDDAPEPRGLLHLAFGLSPHAHARILHMDLDAVRAAPGVVAVFTAADIPGDNNVAPVAKDDRLLADGLVEYAGQAVFLVAANSADAARRAAKLGRIDCEPLPAILTIAEARAAGSVLEAPQRMARGDAASAIDGAPRRLSGSVEIGGQDHFYLEGQIAVATPGEDGTMHVLSSTQHPSEVQHLIAYMLSLRSADVTVEVRRMGGGFGGKETQAALFAAACALVAAKTGRAAKFRVDRDDDMIITGKRHEFACDYDVGFDEDGRIEGIRIDLASRCGMSLDLSLAINDRAMFHADNCYYLENVEIVSHRFRTHTVSNTAFRGFGGPQGMLVIERVMDAMALHLTKDPLEVRRANFYKSGRDVTPYGMTVEDFVADRIVEDLRVSSNYDRRREAIEAFNAKHPYLKRGIAITPVKFGISFTTTHLNQGGALIHLYADGSIHLNHGGTEMGQGLHIKVAQIVADVFAVPLDAIRITATRTDKVPNTSATAASSGTDLNGMAAWNAAMTLRGRLAEFMAVRGDCRPDEVVFANGRVIAGTEALDFGHVCRLAHIGRVSLSATGYYATPKIHYDRATHQGRPFLYFAYGAAVSEVVIDTFTGESRVVRADLLHDAGRSLNPAIDLGQVEGAYIQGLGWLMTEELVFDDKGRLLTHAPSTYKIPCASDRPDVFNVHLWHAGHNREPTIHRSKAVGEPPFMLALSVLSALTHAVSSVTGRFVPLLDTPATPERILRALGKL